MVPLDIIAAHHLSFVTLEWRAAGMRRVEKTRLESRLSSTVFNNWFLIQIVMDGLQSVCVPLWKCWQKNHEEGLRTEACSDVPQQDLSESCSYCVENIYSGASLDSYPAWQFFARHWLFAITIAICKTVIPMGEFRWTMCGPCFANRFSLDDNFDSSLHARKKGVFGT